MVIQENSLVPGRYMLKNLGLKGLGVANLLSNDLRAKKKEKYTRKEIKTHAAKC